MIWNFRKHWFVGLCVRVKRHIYLYWRSHARNRPRAIYTLYTWIRVSIYMNYVFCTYNREYTKHKLQPSCSYIHASCLYLQYVVSLYMRTSASSPSASYSLVLMIMGQVGVYLSYVTYTRYIHRVMFLSIWIMSLYACNREYANCTLQSCSYAHASCLYLQYVMSLFTSGVSIYTSVTKYAECKPESCHDLQRPCFYIQSDMSLFTWSICQVVSVNTWRMSVCTYDSDHAECKLESCFDV